MPDLSLSGVTAGQPSSDAATVSPFAGVSVTSTAQATPYATVRVALSSTANGALSHLGVGTLSADGATYSVSGSPAVVQAALRGLVFTPAAHEVPVGQSVTTGFALTVFDTAGAVTDARTTVVAIAADTLPTVTNTSAVQAPTASRSGTSLSDPGASSFTPFAYTTIADPDAGAVETTSITLKQNGVATDAAGLLSGAGLTKTGVGTYTLAAGSPAAESAALEALRFSPTNLPTNVSGFVSTAGSHVDVTLAVSDGFVAPVTHPATIGLPGNPGGDTIVANSVERPVTYADTPVTQATHTYATTIDAVLNGVVLYERGFDLPYADPQVQAAVTQAQAAVRAAGATPGAPQQASSNVTTLSSQTSTAQTGSAEGTPVITQTQTFGPNFVGPNTSVATQTASESDRGYLYVLPGQLEIDINTVTPTTVSRTVTTTSTDLLSQQYVITGTPTAMPTTTLVSSSSAGVEGDSTSASGSLVGRFTSDGSTTIFTSAAENLTSTPTNQSYQLYTKVLGTGALSLVSVTAGGVAANNSVNNASIDGNGGLVGFTSAATNLGGPADGYQHLYLKNTVTGALTLVAPTDYIFRNAITGAVEPPAGFNIVRTVSLSTDGRYVAAEAAAGPIANSHVVIFDTQTHTALDLTADAYSTSERPVFSQDGGTVVFTSTGQYVSNDPDTVRDVYAYHIASNTFELASSAPGANGPDVKGNQTSQDATVSADGTRVAFTSNASNLDYRDTDTMSDIYVKDLDLDRLFLVDITQAGVKANALSRFASISADGTKVVFSSQATNLAPGATDGTSHVYLKDLSTGALTLLDTTPAGTPADNASQLPWFSPDGTKVGYESDADNLVANDTNRARDVFVTTLSAAVTPANTPPVLGGVGGGAAVPAGVATAIFKTATVTDPDAGQTETVTINFDPTHGTLSGGGFSGSNGVYSGAFGSAALAQAALRAVTFTPTAGQTTETLVGVTVSDGVAPNAPAANGLLDVVARYTPLNTPPILSGTQAGQADAAGVAIAPFSTVTVTDPDAGQSETVTVSFLSSAGTLSGGGFTLTQTANNLSTYTVTAAAGGAGMSAATAQADLRAVVFTPTAGQSATIPFVITVSDGAFAVTNSTTSVVATYTASPTGGGGNGSVTVTTPPSVQYGLLTEFQNLERALADGVDALIPDTPVNAAFTAYKAVAAQLDNASTSLAHAESTLAHLVDGTTAVAVASYGFFTGSTPTAAGLNYLVHSGANATDLNDAYYARFTTENRYINFAVNLASGQGAGAAAFQASYGALSLPDAAAKAYAAVFGVTADAAKVSALLTTLVPDGLGGEETRAAYFAQYGGDGPGGQGTKAAMIGFLLSQAVHDGSGVYGAATETYLSVLAHGQAPVFGSELALHYGAAVGLVGVTPTPDPTVAG